MFVMFMRTKLLLNQGNSVFRNNFGFIIICFDLFEIWREDDAPVSSPYENRCDGEEH